MLLAETPASGVVSSGLPNALAGVRNDEALMLLSNSIATSPFARASPVGWSPPPQRRCEVRSAMAVQKKQRGLQA